MTVPRSIRASVVTAFCLALLVPAATLAAQDSKGGPKVPTFVEEAASAGVIHTYDGDFDFYVGGGVGMAGAVEQLRCFIDKTGIPSVATLKGLGSIVHDHPGYLGMLGMHGGKAANLAVQECDLLLVVGARFDDRVTGKIAHFCPQAKIIHIDIDPSSISKNVRVDVPIVGSVKSVLSDMLKVIRETGASPDPENLENWWERIEAWRGLDCLYYEQNGELIKPQYAIEVMNKVTHSDAFVTSDVGQHQMFAAQFYKFEKPRRWINSGGLGTMGFGLPAAMGVQLGNPGDTVACITGEGSIQMCIQELSTCLQYNLPIKVVNLNNRYLGMVRQWQEFFYQGRYAMSYMESLPDFVKLAESYGHVGMQIDKPADVEGALREAMAMKDRLVFLDFITDQSENVYPMIPAGGGQNEMILV